MTASVLIVIDSLAAEGTPRLALELSRVWQQQKLRPVIMVIHAWPDDLRADFDALNIDRVVLDLSDHGYWRYALLAFWVFATARRQKAVAVLSMPLGWHSIMAIAARLAGVQHFVAHVGNYPNPSSGRAFKKFRALVRLGRPFTDQLVCCSRYVQDGARRHFGVDARETCVIYNGVPLQDFSRRATAARQKRACDIPFTIGMVARLEAHKDHATLIGAARILKLRGRRIRVQLVGDGSQRADIAERISISETGDVVTLLGMRRDVPELVGGFDLFVFSTTPDEGMGIALVEAMASGVPVIASDVGACREVLDSGRLGVLVTPGDPTALADAIETNMLFPSDALSRAQEAQKRAVRDFSINDMANRYGRLLGLTNSTAAAASSLDQAELWR